LELLAFNNQRTHASNENIISAIPPLAWLR